VFKIVFCRHLSPSYTYGDFQTTGAVVESKKSPHTPMVIFKLPVLSWGSKKTYHTPMVIFKLPLLYRGLQKASKRTFEHIWDTYGSENSGGIWIIGDQKVNTG
jgi:hypothetical protein